LGDVEVMERLTVPVKPLRLFRLIVPDTPPPAKVVTALGTANRLKSRTVYEIDGP